MPARPQESLLNLNLDRMSSIDTRSVEDLFGLWTVFSKTSNALPQGKRLENMSWRLWNREAFCCSSNTKRTSRTSVASGSTKSSHIPKVPELASSIDTVSSSEEEDFSDSSEQSPPPHVVRPELTRLDSTESRSRGREKHISPGDLKNIVESITTTGELESIESLSLPILSTSPTLTRKEREAPPKPKVEIAATTQNLPIRTRTLDSSASTVTSSNTDESPAAPSSSESSSTAMSTHDVVRGFIPGGAASSYRSQTQLATQPAPILKNSPRHLPTNPKKKGAFFTLGTSSGEEESSLESHLYKSSISSLSEGLHKQAERKQASFREENLVSKIQDSPVFESDDEDDDDEEEVSEGVIEDDEDSSDWEDELGDDDKSDTEDGPVFQRVDSRPNLTSRRSLLTSLMHEGDRARALQNAASRSTPAIRRTQTTPPESTSRTESPAREPNGPDGHQNHRTGAIAMAAANSQPHLALSPRTTRRNMLSTELTESLRRNLLWERQHKSSQNVAALRRRHTSHDVKNLKQYPELPHMSAKENKAKFNNDYFHAGLGEYHSKGW